MPAKRGTSKVFKIIGLVLLMCFGWIAFEFYSAWHKFSTEDQISDTYQPVFLALHDFQHELGSPATNLSQLMPRYLPRLPSSPLADSIDYRILADGTNWQLSVHSRAFSQARTYVHRSSDFTVEERKRIVTALH